MTHDDFFAAAATELQDLRELHHQLLGAAMGQSSARSGLTWSVLLALHELDMGMLAAQRRIRRAIGRNRTRVINGTAFTVRWDRHDRMWVLEEVAE